MVGWFNFLLATKLDAFQTWVVLSPSLGLLHGLVMSPAEVDCYTCPVTLDVIYVPQSSHHPFARHWCWHNSNDKGHDLRIKATSVSVVPLGWGRSCYICYPFSHLENILEWAPDHKQDLESHWSGWPWSSSGAQGQWWRKRPIWQYDSQDHSIFVTESNHCWGPGLPCPELWWEHTAVFPSLSSFMLSIFFSHICIFPI